MKPIDPTTIDPNTAYPLAYAAELIGVSKRTLESWRTRGLYKPVGNAPRRGKPVLIRGADLLRIVFGDEPPVIAESPAQRERAAEKTLRDLGVLR